MRSQSTVPWEESLGKESKSAEGDVLAVLVMCGCFSPPTLAHMEVMEAAREHAQDRLGLRVLACLFSPTPAAYKKEGLARLSDRVAMLRFAIDDFTTDGAFADSVVDVDTWEGAHDCVSVPTINVLDSVRLRAEEAVDGCVRVLLVLGSDMLMSWAIPGLWPAAEQVRILADHGAIVVPRTDAASEDVALFVREMPCVRRHAQNLHHTATIGHAAVSSSGVRAAVATGESLGDMVSPSVASYIASRNLFSIY